METVFLYWIIPFKIFIIGFNKNNMFLTIISGTSKG